MGSPGKVAFGVILGLGALTGILAYYLFGFAAPEPGVMYSVSRVNLPITTATSSQNEVSNTSSKATTQATNSAGENGTGGGSTKLPAAATITIPAGASVQGNPSYDPDSLTVKKGDTIAVDNKDTAAHTVTNGKAPGGPDVGKIFDTSIINAGESSQIATANIKPGDYPFHCSVHPYMTGTLKVQ